MPCPKMFLSLKIFVSRNEVFTFFCRYMCRLSDQDLRMAGTRNMMDLMWAAVKEPIETHVTFDREGLDLAFKYFTCSTLTIRLTGISQINVRTTAAMNKLRMIRLKLELFNGCQVLNRINLSCRK